MVAIRVGVIGGSYAGCCLARMLVTKGTAGGGKKKRGPHSKDLAGNESADVQVKVLELRSEQELRSIPGSLNFYGCAERLHQLEIDPSTEGDAGSSALDDGNGRGRTSKSKLFCTLVDSLPRGTISFESRVERIKYVGKVVVVTCTDLSSASDSEVVYEFDVLVAADGLTSGSRSMITDDSVPCFLLGDASRLFGREFCFGLLRTRYGASHAMKDSCHFAESFFEIVRQSGGVVSSRVLLEGLASYTIRAWRARMRRNAAFLILFAGIFVCFILYNSGQNSGTRISSSDL